MATITWTGAAGDNNFNNPANWSPMQVPGSGDTAVISTSAAETVTVANTVLGGLTLGSHDTLSIDDNQSLTIGSGTGSTTLSIAGTLLLNSTGDSTGLILADTLTMLTGGGQLVLNNTGYPNYVEGTAAANTLDNVNDTISGAGNFGNGQLTFVNGASGIFDANDSNALYLNTGTTSTNSGLIEATGTGGLVIESSVNNGTLGHVSAAGGVVSLNGKTIQGGTLSSSGAGKIDVNNGTLDGSANTVSNTGSVQVDDNQALYALGTIANTGTIEVDSTGDSTGFVVGSPTLTLTGAGTLTSSLQGYSNYIEGSSSGDTLVNASNIYFGGNFGNGSTLSVVNSGVINASQAPALYLNLAATLTNDKLIEETAAGGITIDGNTTINNTSGTISAIGTGGVTLQNGADIMAGHLTSTGGTFYSNGGTLDGKTHGAVVTSAAIQVDDNQALYVLGTLNNTGTITVASAGDSTGFVVDSSSVTLTGGGVVTTTGENNANFFEGAATADVLDNANNTLDLSGNFGNGQLTFVNSGTLNANQTTGLTINTGGSFTNHALVEETGTGGIAIQSDTIVANAGGTIAATGAGGITLNGGTIQGGLLTSKTGQFYSNNGTLDGSTAGSVTSSGAFQVDDNNSLHLLGTIANSGTITIDSTGDSTGIYIDSGTVSLTGSGVVTTSGSGYANYFYGSTAGNVLDNVNNTLNISGNFGDGQLTFVNNYIVDADQSAALVLNTGGSFTNNDLVEETSSGGIYIDGNTAISNGSVGTVSATGTGGVTLANNATIYGGVLTSGTGGGFYSNNGTLNGASNTITSSAYIQVDDNNSLHLLGTVINTGTIAIDSTGDSTGIYVDSPTLTLTGGGLVTTSAEGYGNYFYGSTGGYTLDNVNNTFDISGNFGAGQLTFINNYIVDANQGASLVLNTGGSFTNNDLVEETSTGGIVIDSNTTVSNGAHGTFAATGTGGVTVNGGTIAGGVLTSGAGGGFYFNNGVLSGVSNTVTSSAYIQADDNARLYAAGTISNSGTIEVNSTGDSTGFYVDSPTLTLTGGGTVTTSNDGYNNYFYANTGGDVLNNVDNTFNISGNFGDGSGLAVVNGGTFVAGQSSELYLNTGATFLNNGQLIASGSGGLDLRSVILTNGSTGTIAAMSGSTLVSESGGTLTNDSSAGTLSAGTYAAIAGASAATLNFNGHAVMTLNANAVLSGTGSEISFGGVAIETDLSQISKTGELQVLGNRAYTSKKILTNNGNLVLGGGSFHPYALSNSSSGTISGFGTIAAKLTDNGALVASGGALELLGSGTAIDGAVSGSGTLSIGGTTTLGTKTTLSVSDIVLLSKSSLDLGTSVSFAGTFNVTGTAALAGPGTFTNTGLFESTGKGVGTISAPVSSSGTIETAANTTLAFSGGLTNTGLILDNGVFTDTAALTGGSLTLSKTSKATIASTVGSPNSTLATLTSAGGALNTSNTTITVTGDYNNTAAGSGNSYNPFAGVTGTIDANGTQLAVVGVDGTTISNVNGTLTIAIASGGTAHFVIENAGPSGDTLLRGALQTSVNGGSITTSALSGSGVKAGNYGPVAGGSSTGTYAISYNGSTPLTGQAIHIASDFANVAGVTIDIVASNPAAPALGTTVSSEPAASTAWVPSLHHG